MNWKRYLPLIGIFLFIYILIRIGIFQVLDEISKANLFFLLIAIFFIFISFVTSTLKWSVLAHKQKMNVPFKNAFNINLIENFYGFITPSKIGGIIRSDYLREYNDNHLGKGVSNYVLDKVLDLCSLVFLVVIFSFMFRSLIPISLFYYAALGLIFLVSCLIIFREENRSKLILRIFYRKLIPEKIKEKAKDSFYSFYQDIPKKSYFILFFLLNLLNWVVLCATIFFIGLSLGINISFFYFLVIIPIATLIGQIPITISGLGTREAIMISLFGLFGVGTTKVFSMALLNLFIAGIIPAVIGSFLIFKKRKSI